MTKKKSLYPITVKLVRDNKRLVIDVFKEVRPHKNGFIDVCELKGCFAWKNVGATYEALSVGEVLLAKANDNARSFQPLEVIKNDGTLIGYLPYSESVLPNMLIKRGVKVLCYVEAKEFNGGFPSVAVSVYADEY